MANFNFNKVIIGGRMTADVELKQTQNGIAVCSFSVAVNRRTNKDEATTDFLNCTAWRNTAEFISKYFRKGSSICLVGSLQIRTWTDQQGQKRYTTEILVDEASFVDSKNEAEQAEKPSPQNYIPESYIQPQTENFAPVTQDDDLPF